MGIFRAILEFICPKWMMCRLSAACFAQRFRCTTVMATRCRLSRGVAMKLRCGELGKLHCCAFQIPNLILAKPEHVVPTCHLIGGWPNPPEKWWSSSDWIIIPTIGENKNHVPVTTNQSYVVWVGYQLSRLVNRSVLGASNKVTSQTSTCWGNILKKGSSKSLNPLVNHHLSGIKIWVNSPFSDPNGLG